MAAAASAWQANWITCSCKVCYDQVASPSSKSYMSPVLQISSKSSRLQYLQDLWDWTPV